MYYLLLNGDADFNLSKNFTKSELTCKCGRKECSHGFIYQTTLESAQRFRDFRASGLKINSAFRCQSHNKAVGGVSHSFHTNGHALDFQVPASENINEMATQAEMFFDVVIKYTDKNFIHCHNRIGEYK